MNHNTDRKTPKLEALLFKAQDSPKPHTKIKGYPVYEGEIGFESIKEGQKFMDWENSRLLNLSRQRKTLLLAAISVPISSGILATRIGLKLYEQYHPLLTDDKKDILIAEKSFGSSEGIHPIVPPITFTAGFAGGLGVNYLLGAQSWYEYMLNPLLFDLADYISRFIN